MQDSSAVAMAYDLNNPMYAQRIAKNEQGCLPECYSLISCDAKNFVLETIKQAENTEGIVVRGYECNNKRTPVTLQCGFPVKKAYACNLLEEKEMELPIKDGKISFTVNPFEIYSIYIEV